MTDPIETFAGQHRFLSNFFPSAIVYEGILYLTVEHAFQAQKSLELGVRQWIADAATPSAAKARGRGVTLRTDWEAVKFDVMKALLAYKFRDPTLRAKLLATGDAALVEGNTWGDRVWGVYRGIGQNHLGRLLMEVRSEIQKGGGP
jgi:ribA/ribD-fused uncharacterized protein